MYWKTGCKTVRNNVCLDILFRSYLHWWAWKRRAHFPLVGPWFFRIRLRESKMNIRRPAFKTGRGNTYLDILFRSRLPQYVWKGGPHFLRRYRDILKFDFTIVDPRATLEITWPVTVEALIVLWSSNPKHSGAVCIHRYGRAESFSFGETLIFWDSTSQLRIINWKARLQNCEK